jgi:hypothetical protein
LFRDYLQILLVLEEKVTPSRGPQRWIVFLVEYLGECEAIHDMVVGDEPEDQAMVLWFR